MNLIPGLNATASALNAERIRMEVVSENIANVNTTRDVNGKPYQRQYVVFETALNNAQNTSDTAGGASLKSVQISKVEKDTTPGQSVPMPGHPDADENGMVQMPNVAIHQEMVDLISSSRTFEANLAVIKNARQMAMQTLSIAKH
jgi:flagellar basal-body rod protein FlgC